MSENATTFSFLKGGEDILSSKEGEAFNWEEAASTVRGQLSNAMNARNVAFLLGSGCSSYYSDDQQVGIPTMAPMAKTFLDEVGANEKSCFVTKEERDKLKKGLGLDIATDEFSINLERLMEVLFSAQLILKHNSNEDIWPLKGAVETVIKKVSRYVLKCCSEGAFSNGDVSVADIYQAFYKKLIFRDRTLPRPQLVCFRRQNGGVLLRDSQIIRPFLWSSIAPGFTVRVAGCYRNHWPDRPGIRNVAQRDGADVG